MLLTMNLTPESPNYENDFIAELARENCLELNEIDSPISFEMPEIE